MALKQLVPIEITLIGDGASTVFTFPLANMYQNGTGNSIPVGGVGTVPSSISIPNPPVAVTSSSIDAYGNVTITLTSALGSNVQATFELDLLFTSGGVTSTVSNPGLAVSPVEVPLTASGSISSLNAAVTLSLNGIRANTSFSIQGTWSATLAFEASNDGTNWTTIYAYQAGKNVSWPGVITDTGTGSLNDIYRCTTAGYSYARVRVSAYTSGTIVVVSNATQAASVTITQASILGLVASTPPTYTSGNGNSISLTTSGALRQDSTSYAGTALGAPTNFGTTPGAVISGSVNASLFLGTTAAATTSGALNVANRPAAPTTSLFTSAAISFSASGTNTLVAGSGSTTIRVYRIFFVNSDASNSTNITIQDSTPTSFSGAFSLTSTGSFSADGLGDPLFVTAAGKGFVLNSSVDVQISGTIWYTQS